MTPMRRPCPRARLAPHGRAVSPFLDNGRGRGLSGFPHGHVSDQTEEARVKKLALSLLVAVLGITGTAAAQAPAERIYGRVDYLYWWTKDAPNQTSRFIDHSVYKILYKRQLRQSRYGGGGRA